MGDSKKLGVDPLGWIGTSSEGKGEKPREEKHPGRKEKEFFRLRVGFRNGHLGELKGPPLSIFVCMGLHADRRGICEISTSELEKETNYSRPKVLEGKYYLICPEAFGRDREPYIIPLNPEEEKKAHRFMIIKYEEGFNGLPKEQLDLIKAELRNLVKKLNQNKQELVKKFNQLSLVKKFDQYGNIWLRNLTNLVKKLNQTGKENLPVTERALDIDVDKEQQHNILCTSVVVELQKIFKNKLNKPVITKMLQKKSLSSQDIKQIYLNGQRALIYANKNAPGLFKDTLERGYNLPPTPGELRKEKHLKEARDREKEISQMREIERKATSFEGGLKKVREILKGLSGKET